MLSITGIILVAFGFLIACMLTMYLYFLRINQQQSSAQTENVEFLLKQEASSSSEEDLRVGENKKEKSSKGGKSNKNKSSKNGQSKGKFEQKAVSSIPEAEIRTEEPEVIAVQSFVIAEQEEDDILALARLQGHDISSIKRRNGGPSSKSPRPSEVVSTIKTSSNVVFSEMKSEVVSTTTDSSVSVSISSVVVEESESQQISEVVVEEPESEQIPEPEVIIPAAIAVAVPFYPVETEAVVSKAKESEWSHVPTRDEEIARNLKNKLTLLQDQLEESDRNNSKTARALEQSQRRIALLEQELKDQRKSTLIGKASFDSQLASLRAINHDMATKLALVESSSVDASIAKNEADRAKESSSRLQNELYHVKEQNQELEREVSELRTQQESFISQILSGQELFAKCSELGEELAEVRRSLELQVEFGQEELINLKKKLDAEISFHRAEHANAVGASAALHQEISQLKSELELSLENKLGSEEELNSLVLENAAMKKELETLRTLSEDSTQSDELKTQIDDLNRINDSLKSEVESFKSRSSELDAAIMNRDEEINNLKSQVSELDGLRIKAAQLESLKSQVADLEAQVNELQSQVESVSQTIENGNNDNENENDSEVESLKAQLAESEIKVAGLLSDVAREIKRADISKRVYEAKLAELESKNQELTKSN